MILAFTGYTYVDLLGETYERYKTNVAYYNTHYVATRKFTRTSLRFPYCSLLPLLYDWHRWISEAVHGGDS